MWCWGSICLSSKRASLFPGFFMAGIVKTRPPAQETFILGRWLSLRARSGRGGRRALYILVKEHFHAVTGDAMEVNLIGGGTVNCRLQQNKSSVTGICDFHVAKTGDKHPHTRCEMSVKPHTWAWRLRACRASLVLWLQDVLRRWNHSVQLIKQIYLWKRIINSSGYLSDTTHWCKGGFHSSDLTIEEVNAWHQRMVSRCKSYPAKS